MHRVQDRRTESPLIPRAVAAFAPLGVAALSVGADQVTKTIAESALKDGPVNLFLGARFVLTYNSGAAFSVGAGRSGIFTVLASVTVLALIGYSVWSRQPLSRQIMFGLIIGGAAGNLVDRLARGNGGRVIDFIEFARWYPVCNVADVSLFFGIVLMLVLSFREERSARRSQ